MRAPRRLTVTIAAGAPAVAGGSTLADAHDGGGQHRGKRDGNPGPQPVPRPRRAD